MCEKKQIENFTKLPKAQKYYQSFDYDYLMLRKGCYYLTTKYCVQKTTKKHKNILQTTKRVFEKIHRKKNYKTHL